jgi:hypothetical protein
MSSTTIEQTREEAARRPVYWFVILDLALESGNYQQQTRAIQELRKLGIDVTLRKRPRTARGGAS